MVLYDLDDDWLNATVFSLRPGSERHLKYSRVTFNSDSIASPLKERGGCHPVLSGKSLPVSGKNFPFYERPMIRDATATGNW